VVAATEVDVSTTDELTEVESTASVVLAALDGVDAVDAGALCSVVVTAAVLAGGALVAPAVVSAESSSEAQAPIIAVAANKANRLFLDNAIPIAATLSRLTGGAHPHQLRY
jgi:hypothetical protein